MYRLSHKGVTYRHPHAVVLTRLDCCSIETHCTLLAPGSAPPAWMVCMAETCAELTECVPAPASGLPAATDLMLLPACRTQAHPPPDQQPLQAGACRLKTLQICCTPALCTPTTNQYCPCCRCAANVHAFLPSWVINMLSLLCVAMAPSQSYCQSHSDPSVLACQFGDVELICRVMASALRRPSLHRPRPAPPRAPVSTLTCRTRCCTPGRLSQTSRALPQRTCAHLQHVGASSP